MSKIESFLQILSSYNISPEATTILDIGFGNGKFTIELGKIFKKVVAIDSSTEAVKTLKKRASDYSNISGELDILKFTFIFCNIFFQLTILMLLNCPSLVTMFLTSSSAEIPFTSSKTFQSFMMM